MRHNIKLLLLFSIGALLSCGFIAATVLLYLSKDLPTPDQITNRQVSQSTKIYDRTGEILLYELSAGEKRTVVPIEDIPKHVRDATVAIEDERFYNGPAFDWRGYLRALWVNLRSGEIRQGGSTITIQLARNAFLSTEQTIVRKIRELILAIRLSNSYTKDEILSLYLNEIPYGATIYGVEAAAQAYFAKPVKELTLAEGAVIAAIPKAPTYYSPWGSHTQDLFNRQKLILRKMQSLGMITNEELAGALIEEITIQPQGKGILAPHFVIMVQEYLVRKYGEDIVRNGGLRVITTLDWELQEIAERAVSEGAARNEELYDGKNASLVAQDPKTGQILALVGSRDYFDIEHEGSYNVAAQGLRQPGSALKPFAYLTAFEKGYLPETVLFDVPTEFAPNNPSCPIVPLFTEDDEETRCFHPQNFDEAFRGPVSLRTALAHSINIPAVKVLYLAGLEDTLQTLRSFGITTLDDPRRYGLSLVLGGGEVRLTELVGAYGVLASDGVYRPQSYIAQITDHAGRTLEAYEDSFVRVIEPQSIRLINSVLSDVPTRSGLFGGSLNLTVFPGYDVALKTGTSNDYRDAWALGYTPSFVAGVWAGNNNNAPMHRRGSSILAAIPIWSAFMKEALLKYPQGETFTKPDPVIPSKPVLAGDYLAGNQVHSILYHVDRTDPVGNPPLDPTRDAQFNNWETAILFWVGANWNQFSQSLPSSSLAFSLGFGQRPRILIHSPSQGAYIAPGPITVYADVYSTIPLSEVIIRFNGAEVSKIASGLSQSSTILFSFTPQNTQLQNILEIEAKDSFGLSEKTNVVVYR